jgi:hypothetical protein
LASVDAFLDASDFFTLDVADCIGAAVEPGRLADFVARHKRRLARVEAAGLAAPLAISEASLAAAGAKYLRAVAEAGRIYRRIAAAKGAGTFVTEISLDETDCPQTPGELLVILAAVADEEIPAETIAPRFSGRFNKGVDYVGSVAGFTGEFAADVAVLAVARREFDLPDNLKLSVHSGSDKFSLYAAMRRVLREHRAGVHVKTAGTTWLEELAALAFAGGDGLEIAKEIAAEALVRRESLCAPYAAVVDIDPGRLPDAATIRGWDGPAFAAALRHDPACRAYNPDFRQLVHVGYRLAAELGPRFTAALEKHAEIVARGVSENLFDRHVRPLFLGED